MEDDLDLGESLCEVLRLEGYEVELARDGIEASDLSYQHRFDCYVLDINVPHFNGMELLEALRAAEDRTPTIFISAMVDIETMSRAFGLGADDYIKKPFYPQELILRLQHRLQPQEQLIVHGELHYNPQTQALHREGVALSLSRSQRELFDFFIQNRHRDLSKEEILEHTSIANIASLRVAITKLKQQTGLAIKNLHGIGYRVEEG